MEERDVTAGADGRVYTDPKVLLKRQRRDYAIELKKAHPTLTLPQLMELHAKRFPGYSEVAFRQSLRSAGLKAKTPFRRRTNAEIMADRERKSPPKAKPIIRASVHGYHGRSRLLSSYLEL